VIGSDWLSALHDWELNQSLDLGHSLSSLKKGKRKNGKLRRRKHVNNMFGKASFI